MHAHPSPGDHWRSSGPLAPVIGPDPRPGGPAPSIPGQVSDSTGSLPDRHLGRSPSVVGPGADTVAGNPVGSGFIADPGAGGRSR